MKRLVLAAGAVLLLGSGAAGCGGGDEPAASPQRTETPAAAPAAPVATEAAQTFGTGCAGVPSTAGGFAGMAAAPVVAAVSGSPELNSFATVVKKAGMVETLDSAPEITVFAPSNAAWAALPQADLDDGMALTGILLNLIVEGRQGPDELASGALETLGGGELKVSGADGAYKVADATIVCGNIRTGNATVHVIDKVLLPAEE
ncbi:fasciclin domain-containing protein [Actinocorallia sp. API 0066]|uniref:fasciclin domain-containing protein n=1 Tax=Actinocorallia sp. API 0066 TaxID=2896846 RepID=UPI001E620AA8|nr:fasciclin domain-containing protein [Actinocorallia sp. API 0066]MCD0453274.1 fasciclin domain-containing protein [Actinocorallia sp. API 0066]